MNPTLVIGWCFNFFRCGGVAVECVRQRFGETCIACKARELNLPEGTEAADVIAALPGEGKKVAA
jgi:hypothetical protein